MSVPKCLFFFQDLEGLTEVFGRMSAEISGLKLPLWAEFSFLTPIPVSNWSSAMLEFPGEGVNDGCDDISGFLQTSAFWALSVTLGPSP